jgi:YHS domain-containing protein
MLSPAAAHRVIVYRGRAYYFESRENRDSFEA